MASVYLPQDRYYIHKQPCPDSPTMWLVAISWLVKPSVDAEKLVCHPLFLMTCSQKDTRDKQGKQIIEISILVESHWCRSTFEWRFFSCEVRTIPSWSTLQTWPVAMMAHYLQLFLWWFSRKLRESNPWDDDFVVLRLFDSHLQRGHPMNFPPCRIYRRFLRQAR